MSWKSVLKEEGPVINWLSEEKIMGHVDGRGPYTKDSIAAELKKVGTFDKRIEYISGEKTPTSSAWD